MFAFYASAQEKQHPQLKMCVCVCTAAVYVIKNSGKWEKVILLNQATTHLLSYITRLLYTTLYYNILYINTSCKGCTCIFMYINTYKYKPQH